MTTVPPSQRATAGIFGLTRRPRVTAGGKPGPAPTPPEASPLITKREKQRMAAEARAREENLPVLKINSLTLNIMSTQEIKNQSVVKVTSSDLYGPKTVNDTQMGVTEETLPCSRCGKDNLECPGHMGRIELNIPIINPLFRRDVIRVLNCVCNSCGGLLLNEAQIREKGILRSSGLNRLKLLEKECLGLPCIRKHEDPMVARCVKNPTYLPTPSKEMSQIVYTYDEKPGKDSKTYIRSVEEIERILSPHNISEQDALLMGFRAPSHPSNFIMRALPVIPPKARPPAIVDGEIKEDPLTLMYVDIIRHNNLLETHQSESDRLKTIQALHYFIDHFIDNADGKFKVGKQEAPGIKQLVQGKEAIVRLLMMGKRVNYSGRTVLGPDPTLKFGQIRIPKAMAPYLTVEVMVTNHNMSFIKQLLREDKITYITPSQGKFRGTHRAITEETKRGLLEGNDGFDLLAVGDKVERHLQNGDYILFNRQPTLHKQSMMGYEVVLGDQLTIGIPLMATKPHNADRLQHFPHN